MIPHSRPTLDKDDIKEVVKVIQSGQIAQGEVVRKFEKKLSRFIGVKDAVAVSSGSAALHLSLLVLGIGKEDEVILPTYLCTAPLNAIRYVGADPVLCDINLMDFNIDVEEVKDKINKKTKAIIVPHIFGTPCQIDELQGFGIPIIEDCAHSIGAKYKGRRVGSFGKVSIFSFYATKMLTTGEGGMILSNSQKILNKIRDLRDYDEKKDYKVRYNYKLSDIQAGLGCSQLSKIPTFISKRKKIASVYNKEFERCDFELPFILIDGRHKCRPYIDGGLDKSSPYKGRERVFYRYVIRIKGNVTKGLNELRRRGNICKRPIFKPLHRYLKIDGFKNSEKVYNSAISIPIYPSLKDEEIKKIVAAVKKVFL